VFYSLFLNITFYLCKINMIVTPNNKLTSARKGQGVAANYPIQCHASSRLVK
jgi:hypothetical protein